MEVYPLADIPPPRYSVESDDEDEYHPLSPPTGSDQPPEIQVEFRSISDIPSHRPVIFASGTAGVSWAKIVNLGEQQGDICVNNHPIGLLFYPSWTIAIVVVSEAETSTRLPLFAMTTYTTAIIHRLQPTSVTILDSYPTCKYISPRAVAQDSVHIRYLSVGDKAIPGFGLQLFAPPNLLQSTTASLLNELFLRSISGNATRNGTTVILLPSSEVPLSPPTTFNGKGVGDFSDPTHWNRGMLESAHKCLCTIVGTEVDKLSLQDHAQPRVRTPVSAGIVACTTLRQIGEGGMYI